MRDANGPEFEDWYRSEHPRLVTLVSVAVGDAEIGRDATDEALARACERWDRVSAMASPSGWTYRVALNVARRRARRRAVEQRLLGRPRAAEVPGPAGELWVLVSVLPGRQRQAVLLRHVGQLTEPEIAAVMRVARGTVSATLRSAYRTLGVALRADDDDGDDTGVVSDTTEELHHERSR
jgi:DNA-directed RNA polymerase specialized sigma24 family protein